MPPSFHLPNVRYIASHLACTACLSNTHHNLMQTCWQMCRVEVPGDISAGLEQKGDAYIALSPQPCIFLSKIIFMDPETLQQGSLSHPTTPHLLECLSLYKMHMKIHGVSLISSHLTAHSWTCVLRHMQMNQAPAGNKQ